MVHSTSRSVKIGLFVGAALLVLVPPAEAQQSPRVRVIRDGTNIWHQGFLSIAAVVDAGRELDVVSQQGRWYEVRLPPPSPPGRTGFIAAGSVVAVEGTPAAPQVQRGRDGARAAPAAPVGGRRIRPFGHVAYGRFAASNTFDAVMGSPGAGWFGGGAELVTGNDWTLQGTVSMYRSTGERVFVLDDVVYKLGIPNTVTVLPITVDGGRRFARERANLTPYVAGGVGLYRFSESSKFSEASERIRQNNIGYHVRGGVETHVAPEWGVAGEVEYSVVPDALKGGVSAAFNETDLGGLQFRVRIIFGR